MVYLSLLFLCQKGSQNLLLVVVVELLVHAVPVVQSVVPDRQRGFDCRQLVPCVENDKLDRVDEVPGALVVTPSQKDRLRKLSFSWV